MGKVGRFWKSVVSEKDPTSSKRVITLIISGIFILAQIAVIFIAFYVIFYTTKGKVDKDLLDTLRAVLEYDFYIIISGLGFIAADGLASILIEKYKSKSKSNDYMGQYDLPPYTPIEEQDDKQE